LSRTKSIPFKLSRLYQPSTTSPQLVQRTI
jgi:hypothetical protein